MTVYTLLIINKAGGLIYNRDFTPGPNPNGTTAKISTNDYLVLAGTFHGVHAITKSLTPRLPPGSSGGGGGGGGTGAGGVSSRPSSRSSSLTRAPASTSGSTSNLPSTAPPSGPSSSTSWQPPQPHLPISGLETLESSFFRLTCFQTHTGTKFLLITDPLMPGVEAVMRGVYERYADHVMKNPFYQMEMPVRVEGWERSLGGWLGGK